MIPRRAARLRKGNVETARRTYQRNGRTVLLIGVAHVAEQQFWDELNNLIPSLGYEVHFEGIAGPKTQTRIGGYAEVAHFLGLLDQGRGLDYEPTWRRTDLTFAEMSEALGAKKMARLERDAAELADIKESGISKRALRRVLILGISLFPILPNQVILDRRNAIAATHIEDSANDVCAIWGAAHLPGIERKLRAKGWKLAEETWHVTITARPQDDAGKKPGDETGSVAEIGTDLLQGQSKRLTTGELSAEYWRAVSDLGVNAYAGWSAHWETTEEMVATLERFATLPHFDAAEPEGSDGEA